MQPKVLAGLLLSHMPSPSMDYLHGWLAALPATAEADHGPHGSYFFSLLPRVTYFPPSCADAEAEAAEEVNLHSLN